MASATLHPGRACLACRRRKTKCDGAKPVCQRCTRLGGECLYDPPERTPQTVRLQTRLRKLENELRSLSQRPSRITQRLQEHISGEAQPRQRAVPPFIPLFPDGSSTSGQVSSSRVSGSIVQLDLLEGYGTSLPRDELEASLRRWDMQSAVPPGLSDYLIRIFLAFRRHFHFYMHIPTFLYNVRLPPSHPDAIHPALMNAILLAACSCAGGVFWELEPVFLERTRRQLEEALAFADRLTHFLWGNVILTSYYLRYGRAVEAQVAVSSVVRIAVAAGLHLVNLGYTRPSITLPEPNQLELRERKQLWHAIHMVDLTVASVCGSSFQVPPNNLASFDNVTSIVATPGAMPSSPMLLLSMTNCAFHTARTFAGQFRSTPPHLRSEAVWAQYSTISNTVTTLRHSLPPVSDPRGTEPLETIGRANPDMVHAHIEIQAATILLANAVLDLPDFGGNQAALEAAFTVAGLMKQAGGEGGILPAIQAPVSLLPCLFIASEVLVREIGRSPIPSPTSSNTSTEDNVRQAAVEQHLETLVDSLVDVTVFYPAWIGWAQKLRDLVQSIESFSL